MNDRVDFPVMSPSTFRNSVAHREQLNTAQSQGGVICVRESAISADSHDPSVGEFAINDRQELRDLGRRCLLLADVLTLIPQLQAHRRNLPE